MDDLIRRKDAITACYDGYADCRDDCVDNIRSLPAVDAVEVVRCGECIHHKPIDYCMEHKQTGWFGDMFCSCGNYVPT